MLHCQAHIFFFKTKNCSNDDFFISCDDRIGKMLHNICISAVVMSLRWASRGPWASCLYIVPSIRDTWMQHQIWYVRRAVQLFFHGLSGTLVAPLYHHVPYMSTSQLAFNVNLHRAVIGPSATLTGRWRPDIDLRRMLTGFIINPVEYELGVGLSRTHDMKAHDKYRVKARCHDIIFVFLPTG